MAKEKNNAVLPQGEDDNISIDEVFKRHDQALVEHGKPASESEPASILPLPPELQRAVQVLCDTYETLDLRVEATMSQAADTFITALSEVEGHEAELRKLVTLLLSGLRQTADMADAQPVAIQLSFDDESDLTWQVLSKLETIKDKP